MTVSRKLPTVEEHVRSIEAELREPNWESAIASATRRQRQRDSAVAEQVRERIIAHAEKTGGPYTLLLSEIRALTVEDLLGGGE